jgi:hypothetical protein
MERDAMSHELRNLAAKSAIATKFLHHLRIDHALLQDGEAGWA